MFDFERVSPADVEAIEEAVGVEVADALFEGRLGDGDGGVVLGRREQLRLMAVLHWRGRVQCGEVGATLDESLRVPVVELSALLEVAGDGGGK